MDLQTFIQLIVSGLTIGCVYSLVGLGFALTLRATDLINFAQGEMVMLGALIGYTLLATMGSPFVVAFAVATIGTGVVGVLLERVILRPMLRRKAAYSAPSSLRPEGMRMLIGLTCAPLTKVS